MKRDVWKLLFFAIIGAVLCHVKMMGCYPFVALWFVAVYMEEFHRGSFVLFMYLFMALWLPIISLCRYGISLLVWMVVVAIFQRMHIYMKRLTQSILAGLVMVGVYCGGTVVSLVGRDKLSIAVLEGMFVAGAGFLLNRPVSLFTQWEMPGKKQGELLPLPAQVQNYSEAMAGLAKCMGELVYPQEEGTATQKTSLEQEIRHRICAPCRRCNLCFGQDGEMALMLDALVESVEKREVISKEMQDKIYTQCERAELLIQEAVSVFEKMELNMSWYRRLCENREMIAGQIDAMAKVMGDCMEDEQLCDDKERWHLMQMRYRLRDVGLRVTKMHFYRRKNGACRMEMDMSARWGNCITMKEILGHLDACSSCEWIAGEENRSIVGREKATYIFIQKPKFMCSYGVAKMVQAGQEISGDSFRANRCEGCRFVMALSDGMGSGPQANQESETVVDMFLRFVESGFSVEVALRLMNAAMIFGAESERFSTLDACLVDEYTGIVDFYKVGAHVSFIKRKNTVEVVGAKSLPMGAMATLDTVPYRSYLEEGDFLVMVTDGVLEYLHVDNPVEVLQDMIEEMGPVDAATFSRKIIERMMLFTGGVVQDDMTVLTLKAMER
ncbi:MAG: SpoIIE family protein phosphatase [Lachnospiraceae bacterium]|nr:SpoIIE family protein phosphatase [Lachnospiraceae bacterium]